MDLLKPHALRPGSKIGVFTPSSPGYAWNEGLFANGVKNLERMGFTVVLGDLTAKRAADGYRAGTPKERAQEFMALIADPTIEGLVSTIGGSNSSSLIPYLDFQKIRDARKLICGFSDVTSLHLAILKHARLQTLYGPSIMCWFGDWPDGVPESREWFLDASSRHLSGVRSVTAPARWSNHKRRWDNGDWQTIPREWQPNDGWRVLSAGSAEGQILALNLNTLTSAAGTDFWPDFTDKVLLLEDMDVSLGRTERALSQLKLCGVFDRLAGLIVGKAEFYNQEGASFGYDQLVAEVVGVRRYPIVTNFDCSHCVPMISIPQLAPVKLMASSAGNVEFEFLDGSVV